MSELEAIANQQQFQVGILSRKAGPNKAVTTHNSGKIQMRVL